jgi:hypothetical protein
MTRRETEFVRPNAERIIAYGRATTSGGCFYYGHEHNIDEKTYGLENDLI